jgi:hypothetical protein
MSASPTHYPASSTRFGANKVKKLPLFVLKREEFGFPFALQIENGGNNLASLSLYFALMCTLNSHHAQAGSPTFSLFIKSA